MGEAKRRKLLDPNYGKQKRLARAKSLMAFVESSAENCIVYVNDQARVSFSANIIAIDYLRQDLKIFLLQIGSYLGQYCCTYVSERNGEEYHGICFFAYTNSKKILVKALGVESLEDNTLFFKLSVCEESLGCDPEKLYTFAVDHFVVWKGEKEEVIPPRI